MSDDMFNVFNDETSTERGLLEMRNNNASELSSFPGFLLGGHAFWSSPGMKEVYSACWPFQRQESFCLSGQLVVGFGNSLGYFTLLTPSSFSFWFLCPFSTSGVEHLIFGLVNENYARSWVLSGCCPLQQESSYVDSLCH